MKIFISYAWGNDAFRANVKTLRDYLLTQKFTVVSDFDHENRPPKEGWPTWMQHSIEDATVVLVVCSPLYKLRFEKRADPTSGKGVVWEGAVITQDLYNAAQQNSKFYPILPDAGSVEDIPTALLPWFNGHYFSSKQANIVALVKECLAECLALATSSNVLAPTSPTGALNVTPLISRPKQASAKTRELCAAALAKLEKEITTSLTHTDASAFKNALCEHLTLPHSANVAQLMAKLDALPQLDDQMYALQIALAKLPIPDGADGEQHPIESAVRALYMRAGIRAVNLAQAEALCGSQKQATRVPEKNEVIIAMLMAALQGEVRNLSLCEVFYADRPPAKQAKGDALIDLDELPFYPFMTDIAIAKEVAPRVHKGFSGLDAQGKPLTDAALKRHVQGRVKQNATVKSRHFRFILSNGASEFFDDEAKCTQLYADLGIPMTKIVADTPSGFADVFSVDAQTFYDLFMQILEAIADSKQLVSLGTSKAPSKDA
jgi:hypothetical protein